MKDEYKTKKQLIDELAKMRQLIGQSMGPSSGSRHEQEFPGKDILYRTILETAPS